MRKRTEHQAGYLQELYRDARSAKHKILCPPSSLSKHVRCNITYEFLSSAWEGQQQVKDTRRGMHRQQLFSETTLSI